MNTTRHLIPKFKQARDETQRICQPLAIEDYGIQSSSEVSPPKWHLAHTTWFFEKFLLQSIDPTYDELFNSYYETVGRFTKKERRGLLSRPLVSEVFDYRARVDEAILKILNHSESEKKITDLIELGIHHEKQHQELLLMDIQHNHFINLIHSPYEMPTLKTSNALEEWIEVERGLYEIGYEPRKGAETSDFAYDNEGPRHQHYLERVALCSKLVTQGEYLDFIENGGYQNPALWLSEGWRIKNEMKWQAPLYWKKNNSQWLRWSPGSGWQALTLEPPVSYLSFYEADAFARWKGLRLPTEMEWEIAAKHLGAATGDFFGSLWQWTLSAYLPYPKFKSYSGALAEYNGKFMSNQMVLRGSSYLTPSEHSRPTYRNFYAPDSRWQPSGVRLVRDL